MAFDWSNVDGYREDMTADEKLELLGNYNAPQPDYTGYVKKDVFDKTASDLASAKKELKSKLSESEQKEQERAEELEKLRNEMKLLQDEKTLATYKTAFLSLGYEDELAGKTANALIADDKTELFKLIGEQHKVLENKYKAESLKANPVPKANDPKANPISAEEKALRKAMGL